MPNEVLLILIFFVMRKAIITSALLCLTIAARADDWMARLADDTPVASVLIPGTHDAATGDGFLQDDAPTAALVACTQEWSIGRQWTVGVRAFDLRPAVRTHADGREELWLYHGEFATRRSFGSVMRQLADSVSRHPTEFAVVVMRHEASASRHEEHWAQLMDSCLASLGSVLMPFSPSLTVGQMRGHILVLSRDSYAPVPQGGYVEGWSHSGKTSRQTHATITGPGAAGKARLCVQDFYDTSVPGAMKTKLRGIKALFGARKKLLKGAGKTPVWTINHCSGYSLTTNLVAAEPVSLSNGYRDNAAHTNALMLNLIEKGGRTPLAGLIMMDFAGTDRSGRYDVMGKKLVERIASFEF